MNSESEMDQLTALPEQQTFSPTRPATKRSSQPGVSPTSTKRVRTKPRRLSSAHSEDNNEHTPKEADIIMSQPQLAGPPVLRVDRFSLVYVAGSTTLRTCPELEAVHFVYSEELKIFLCNLCGIGVDIKSRNLIYHFKQSGHEAVDKTSTKDLGRLATGLKIKEGLPDILPSIEPRFPFDGLPIGKSQDGFMCGACGFMAAHDTVKNHIWDAHKGTTPRPSLIKNIPYQQLASKTKRFAVLASVDRPQDTPSREWFEEAIDEAAQLDYRNLVRANEKDMRKIGPLLGRTRWHVMLAGTNVEMIKKQWALPGKDDSLSALGQLLEGYFNSATDLIDDTEELVLRTVNTDDPNRDGINRTPLAVHHQQATTIKSYIGPIQHLLCCLLFEPSDEDTGYYTFPVSEDLTNWLNILRPTIVDNSQDEFNDAVHEVFRALWMHYWQVTKSVPWGDPTLCFLALHHLRATGEFDKPADVTPVLARLMRAIRLFVLREVHKQVEDMASKAHLEVMQELHEWIRADTQSTFSGLRQIMAYAASLATNTTSMPPIFWIDHENFTEMLYHGQRFKLSYMQKMAYNIQDQMKTVWEKEVCLGLNIELNYDALTDNLTEEAPGYCFLDHPGNPQFKAHRNDLIGALLTSERTRQQFLSANSKDINPLGARKWLQSLAKLEGLSMVAVQLMSGGPARGTELVAMLARNTELRVRNWFGLVEFTALVRQYTKTTHTSGHDRLIPNTPDGFTARMLVNTHALARPMAVWLATRLFKGQHQIPQWYGENMFMDLGKEFTSRRLSELMEAHSTKTVGFAMGLNTHRHIFAAFQRKLHPHIEDIIDDGGESDNVGALQMGHSGKTDVLRYGLSMSAMSGVVEDMIRVFLQNSVDWQLTLQVVPGGLPLTYSQAIYTEWGSCVERGLVKDSPPSWGLAQMGSQPNLGGLSGRK